MILYSPDGAHLLSLSEIDVVPQDQSHFTELLSRQTYRRCVGYVTRGTHKCTHTPHIIAQGAGLLMETKPSRRQKQVNINRQVDSWINSRS